MWKKFTNGFIFGLGFCVAVIIVVIAYFSFFVTVTPGKKWTFSEKTINKPPIIKNANGYLGSHSRFSAGFSDNRQGVLSIGPGKIVGNVIVDGKPVAGLKLRLALNGSVMSQWAVSNEKGIYHISVPYGKYKIDGYELDIFSANNVLTGKINQPNTIHSSNEFSVLEKTDGIGLTFSFVEPIKLILPKKRLSIKESIIIKWENYPGAKFYGVQIYEKKDRHSYDGGKRLFKWSEIPEVSENTFNLVENNIELKKNHFYSIKINAYNDEHKLVSESHLDFIEYHFEVYE